MSYQYTPPHRRPSGHAVSRPLWIKLVSYLIFMPAIFGAAASLLLLRNYLASPEWLAASASYRQVCGGLAALLVAFAVSAGMRYQAMETGKATSPVMRFILVLAIMPFLYFLSDEVMRRGVPAVIAMNFGSPVEHSYVVKRTSEKGPGSRYRKCDRAVYLEETAVGRLCDMPFRFMEELSEGMPVVLIGKGTSMGLFVEDFRKP